MPGPPPRSRPARDAFRKERSIGMKKRALSLLMSLVMLVSMLPTTAWAVDEETTTPTTVNVDFSFAKGNKFEVVPHTLTVAAGTAGSYGVGEPTTEPTVLDAVVAAHVEKYGDNFTAETAGEYVNDGLTTAFGYSGYAGHAINGAYSSVGAQEAEISNGDTVDVFFYEDSTWNDHYAFFTVNDAATHSADAEVGTPFTAGVSAYSYMMAYSGATLKPGSGLNISVRNADGSATSISDVTTDDEGNFSLQFDKEGKYLLFATGIIKEDDQSYRMIPAWCLVNVHKAMTDAERQEAVTADKDALSLTYNGENSVNLPTTGASGKTSIVWSSSDAAVVSNKGVVVKGTEEKHVTLTATITCGSIQEEKTFELTIPALTNDEIEARLETAKAALNTNSLKPTEYSGLSGGMYSYDSELVDSNILTKAREILKTEAPGVEVNFPSTFQGNDGFGQDGTILYGNQKVYADVSFLLTLGSNQKEVTAYSVEIPKHAATKAEKVAAQLDALTADTVLNGQRADSVTTSLKLPVGDTYYGVCITWTSDNDAVVIERGTSSSTGQLHKIVRPAAGQQDAVVTLTANADYAEMAKNYGMCDAGPMPAEHTKQFTFTVKAYSEEEAAANKAEVDRALDEVVGQITLFADKTKAADLNAVTENLMLPAVSGMDTVWTSSNPDAIKAPTYKTGKAAVTRPGLGESDATCVLTVSLTKNGYTNTKDVSVTVKALTQDEITEEQNKLQTVADALTFDVIRGENELASAVTKTLNLYRSVTVNADGSYKWSKAANSLVGYNIDWTYTDNVQQYGKVVRSTNDVDLELTAVVKSADKDYVTSVTVKIPMTVLGVDRTITQQTMEKLSQLAQTIASANTGNSGEWWIMDMSAYSNAYPDSVHKTTDAAKQAYINAAISSLQKSNVGDTTYDKAILSLTAIGADATQLYPVNSNTAVNAVEGLNSVTQSTSVWSAPYTLAAYNQADYAGTETYERTLVDAILAAQGEDGSWTEYGMTLDTTANAIAGLSFYAGESAVDQAIEKGVAYLSAELAKSTNGSYGNANTDAMVVVALASAGIDPSTDVRFVKNGHSLMDGLLSYALADNSGFGYMNGNSYNDYATEQSFRAIVAATQVIKTGQPYNVYDFSANTVVPVRATGSGQVVTPSDPDTEQTITVSFTLKGDTDYWLTTRKVTVKEGSTVYHAFMKAIEGTGITQVGAADGYVRSITKDGVTLGEFTKGENSGWLYKVNGKLPDVGLTSYEIHNGDTIVWYYTEDWTKDPDAGKWSGGGGTTTPANPVPDKTMPFTDVKSNDWYYQSVRYAYDNGLFSGVSHESFGPGDSMDRSMLVTVLHSLDGKPAAGKGGFTDVADGAWYANAVAWAAEHGIVSGVSDSAFAPNGAITREQLAVMLYRYAQYKGYDVSKTADLSGYADQGSISDWAAQAVQWACGSGLMTGRSANSLAPAGTLTRAEAATMLKAFCENVKK